jgi:hypothetical protein
LSAYRPAKRRGEDSPQDPLVADAETDPWMQDTIVLLIVNRKTVAWALGNGDISYLPDVDVLDAALIEELSRRCDVRVYDRRFLLIRFPMNR